MVRLFQGVLGGKNAPDWKISKDLVFDERQKKTPHNHVVENLRGPFQSSTDMHFSSTPPQIEGCLWLVLVVVFFVHRFTLAASVTLLHLVVGVWWFKDTTSHAGFSMSVVLPVVVLQSLELETFALLTCLGLIVAWRGRNAIILTSIGALIALFLSADALCWKYISYFVLWQFLYSIFLTVATKSESLVISSLAGTVVTLFLYSNVPNGKNTFASAAVAGLIGCGVTCLISVYLLKRYNIWLVIAFQVAGTLAFVETVFFYMNHAVPSVSYYPFPRCLLWLLGDFLLLVETPNNVIGVPLSNYVWLGYWGMVLAVTIPLSPGEEAHPIVARKWFHLIAILLFVPVTLLAPRLQSLAYAVSLAVLVIFESARSNIPILDRFYAAYLDKAKGESHDMIVVSHMALIFGCATPLWMVQWVESLHEQTYSLRTVIALWGVMTLGVGDSMGALVGRKFGRIRWGYRNRSVEGSLAMFVSLFVACSLESPHIASWLPSVLFVTALEAFTTQLDNLVLPLAGAALLLLGLK